MPIRGWRAVQCQIPGTISSTGPQPILRPVDIEEFKQTQRAIWGLGDSSELGRMLRPAADALCDACAVSAGQEVLDVAAGDGNFALAAPRAGAPGGASGPSPGEGQTG